MYLAFIHIGRYDIKARRHLACVQNGITQLGDWRMETWQLALRARCHVSIRQSPSLRNAILNTCPCLLAILTLSTTVETNAAVAAHFIQNDLINVFYRLHRLNKLTNCARGFDFRCIIFKPLIMITSTSIFDAINLMWMAWCRTDDRSRMVQVMAWCRSASHCVTQINRGPLSYLMPNICYNWQY